MAVLASVSQDHLKNLLELFPLKLLKKNWPKIKGNKETVSSAIASSQPRKSVIEFVAEYLPCCKQHVYVYSGTPRLKKVDYVAHPEIERVYDADNSSGYSALFLLWCEYTVVLDNPLEHRKIKFLWPVRLDLTKDYAVFRLVILEKDIASQFGERGLFSRQKVIEDEAILRGFVQAAQDSPNLTDLNKGIKGLWETGNIDCIRTQYKSPISTVTEVMDEARGIRSHHRGLYKTLLTCPLFKSQFVVTSNKFSNVSSFSIDPSKGLVGFSRYSEAIGDTDHVVREILKFNK